MNQSKQWDAIVIGSGLGGLSAAARFANSGKCVLVLERNASFGGAATVYRHGALTTEASLHETDGDTIFGPNSAFASLGLSIEVEAITTDVFYEARGGVLKMPIQIPVDLDNALSALRKHLPTSRTNLDSYFNKLQQLYQTLHQLENMGSARFSTLLSLLFSGRLFALVADSRRTLAEKFDGFFADDEAAKFALGAPISYFDDDPRKLSFLLFAGVWSRYVESGSYYFKGGSGALTTALLKHVTNAGGEVRTNANVTQILVDEKEKAVGVEYVDADGNQEVVQALNIFSGIAPTQMTDMLPESRRAKFAKNYVNFELSISLFNISIGLVRPASEFGVAAYSTFVYPDDMTKFLDYPHHAAVFGKHPAGTMPPYVIADYGRLDTGLRRPLDPYSVAITGVDRISWWEGLSEAEVKMRKKCWLDAIIADVDRRYPGLAAAITQSEISIAQTMKSHLGTPLGAVYGFRPTPSRLFGRLPSAATSIRGLWLSSAYTMSGGYAGALQGGLLAANAALKSKLALPA
ncbi:MAG: NAD(P)/FAD-dependent oxidoreductase [Aestuariivirga sp.]